MKLERVGIGEKFRPGFFLPILGAIIFPLSVVLWFLNYFLQIVTRNDETAEGSSPEPLRWMIAIMGSLIFTLYGFRRKSLNTSGAFFAIFVGFFLAISSYCFFFSLLVFFLSSSRATKFRAHKKRKLEMDFKEGGQRNWIQVICNGGMATEIAILYLFDVGHGEFPIDFVHNYRASWLGLAVLGALSCANGDTWASELGSVVGTGSPRLITTWSKCPKGTNGGVSLPGLVFSLLGGLLVGFAYYIALIMTVDSKILAVSPPQWHIIVLDSLWGRGGHCGLGASGIVAILTLKIKLVIPKSPQLLLSDSSSTLYAFHFVNYGWIFLFWVGN